VGEASAVQVEHGGQAPIADQHVHRGEVAVRGSIVDVYPSTADAPVRIDLWGDEVDRLSEFSVHDQRSTDDIDGVGRRLEAAVKRQKFGVICVVDLKAKMAEKGK
jgi:transcription-repair coupling factor (superfamily II helicase)